MFHKNRPFSIIVGIAVVIYFVIFAKHSSGAPATIQKGAIVVLIIIVVIRIALYHVQKRKKNLE